MENEKELKESLMIRKKTIEQIENMLERDSELRKRFGKVDALIQIVKKYNKNTIEYLEIVNEIEGMIKEYGN